MYLTCMYWNTYSAFAQQPHGGCLQNLAGTRYSWFPTGVNVFWQNPPKDGSRAGKSRSQRGLFFDLNFSFRPNGDGDILIQIFHKIVVPGLRVCCDHDEQWYLQGQGYSTHIAKIHPWAITPYCMFNLDKISHNCFLLPKGVSCLDIRCGSG